MEKINLAYFVTSHGFGHAARSSAIMAAMTEINPDFHFEIFTQVPDWFFAASMSVPYTYHDCFSDVGMVQKTPLSEDLNLTIDRLNILVPFQPGKLDELIGKIRQTECKLIICDITPLGIALAKAADIPSVLIENFTWDWIYQGYTAYEPRFAQFVKYFYDIFTSANYHIQTEPVCMPSPFNHLITRPVSRKPKVAAGDIRKRLGIPKSAKMVLISMGGVQGKYEFIHEAAKYSDIFFVIPGESQLIEVNKNLVFLPHQSDFYHPDLMFASDMVIGKAGYSTIAEAYWAGIPFGYVARKRFPESSVMERYIQNTVGGFEITEDNFQIGGWIGLLTDWLSRPKKQPFPPNGADQAARFISNLLK